MIGIVVAVGGEKEENHHQKRQLNWSTDAAKIDETKQTVNQSRIIGKLNNRKN